MMCCMVEITNRFMIKATNKLNVFLIKCCGILPRSLEGKRILKPMDYFKERLNFFIYGLGMTKKSIKILFCFVLIMGRLRKHIPKEKN